MKRSVNFSSPRKYLLSSIARGNTSTWLAPMSAETKARLDRDVQTLDDHHLFNLSVCLGVAGDSVTHSEPHKNVAEILYMAYDDGWRTNNGKFTRQNETRTSIVMWYDALAAIDRAQQLRQDDIIRG